MPIMRRTLLYLSIILFALAAPLTFAQRITAILEPDGGFFYGSQGVVNSATNKIYFNDQLTNAVRIVDGATNQITTVNVGRGPTNLALDTVTNKIYVVNARDNSLTAIDGGTLSTATVNVGIGPAGVAVNQTTNKVYVANSDDNTVTVIDGTTLSTTTVHVDEGPLAVAVNPVTNRIYVGNQRYIGGSSISVIDGASNQVIATIPLGQVAYFYSGSSSLVVNSLTNQVYAIGDVFLYDLDGASNTLSTQVEWPIFECVQAIALNTVTNYIYAADPCTGGVDEINGAFQDDLTTIYTSSEPNYVAIDTVKNRIYAGDPYFLLFSAIDRSTSSGTTFSVAESGIAAVVANPATNTAYASAYEIDVITGASPLQFVPVTPCRLVDTRNTGPVQGGIAQNFDLLSAGCNLPTSGAAYSLNVTLVPVNGGRVGYLTIWPTDQFQPTVSTMNSPDGRVKANAAIVPAGTLGQVSVYVSDTTNVILDTDGYFPPAAQGTYQFYPLTPCRVIDTRGANGDLGGPYLRTQVERDFPVLESSCIPSGVSIAAYSMNFTVVPHSGPLGYLTVWPQGESQPIVSTLNNPTATVVANAAIVPAGTGGGIATYASNNTDLVVDINGYFAAPAQGGLSLYPMTPCRTYDSRQHDGDFIGERTIRGECFVSSAAQAYVFNATVVPTNGPLGYLTLWPDGQQRPNASTLNAYDGLVTSNMAIVPNTNGATDAFALDYTQLILDIGGYFAP